jgi:subtilisin-like proprotein convertase family protein
MKKNSNTHNQFNFDTAAAQRRVEQTILRYKPATTPQMKKIKTIVLLGLLAAVSPLLLQAQTTETYTFTTNRVLPDGNASGLTEVRNVNSAIGTISSLKVRLKVTGEYNGDLYGYVRHSSGFTVLLNRTGKAAGNTYGYSDSGFDVTFQTGAANGDIHLYQNVTNLADGSPLTGIWQPDGRIVDPANVTDASARSSSLTNFNGLNAAGDWTLYLADVESGATNMLTEWSLEISGAAYPMLVWSNPSDFVYGNALGGAQLNATAIYNSTNVPGTFAYSPPAGTYLNAGSGQTLSVTFTPSNSSGFLSSSTNVTVNVLRAPLSIAVNDTNKVYGDALPALTASYSGFVHGDTVASLDTAVTLATTAAASSPVGTYAITATGAVDANYNITHVDGNLTVTPAALNIVANDTNKVYGAALPVFTAGYSGFVNGDTEASLTTPVTLSTTASASSPAGTYTITASSAAYTNYTIAHHNGTLTVAPAAIVVTVDAKTKAFGEALPALTAVYSGFSLGQNTNSLTTLATLATIATATSDVATYAITAIGATSSNYTFSYVASTLTITQSLSSGAIASSANPALPGASVTFTMALNAVAPGAGTPTGTVNFRIDGSVAGAGTLSGGIATFSTSALTHGTHTVAAEYAGSLNFVGTTNALTPDQNINTSPIAGNETIERYSTQGVKVRLATLLANDSDADGDALNIVIGATSANGGTLSLSSGWVFYVPANGFTSADSFTYTITDGHGGSATGTVTVAIKVDNAPGENLTIADLGNGSFRINGSGIPGRTYRLQSTGSITLPDWQDISGGTVTADSTGAFVFTDTPGTGSRYYRSVYP